MNGLKNKRIYKVISLFIKATILLLSFLYIYKKLITNDSKVLVQHLFFENESIHYLYIVCILMLVNWALEARKWQLLLFSDEHITFLKSIKSIFAGITISIFTPNRIGEFTGRIFFLQHADKMQATLKSFIGSALQLLITVLAGSIAIIIYYKKQYTALVSLNPLHYADVLFYVSLFLLSVTILLYIIYKNNATVLIKIKSTIKEALKIRKRYLLHVFLLSLLRYGVFTFQYYLLLLLMNVSVNLTTAFLLITIVFFITSAIPTFALTEIVVRSAVAVTVFSVIQADALAITSASLLLWIINLAIPALIGSIFVWKLQFFKQ